jgi:hypothetical protein
MDRKTKIQLLLDMQENPEQYSEEELKTMLEDDEVRQLMESAALLKQAMTWEDSEINPDVDAEWQRFSASHVSGEKPRRGWLKVAASIIGVLMVSGIALAAIHFVRQHTESGIKSPVQEMQVSNAYQPTELADSLSPDTVVSKVVRFDEATLQKILTDMADYYRLRVEWKNEETKKLRLFYQWDQGLTPSEIIEQLNTFERFGLELNDSTIIVE